MTGGRGRGWADDAALRAKPASGLDRALEQPWWAINRLLLLLTVAALTVWRHHILVEEDLPRVFYGYTSLLVYSSDVLLALTLATWPLARSDGRRRPLRWGPVPLGLALLSLPLLSLVSLTGSLNPGMTLYTSLHLTLLCGLYLYAVNEADDLRPLVWVLGGIVALESVLSVWQFAGRSTYPAGQLFLGWPAEMVAAQSGASVVETVAGARWLRAYGSTPHPNVLGGLLTATLLPLAGWYLRGAGRWGTLALGVTLLGTTAAVLTFSRSAWLGLAVGGAALAFLAGNERRSARGIELALGVALVWLTLGALFADLMYTRLGDSGARLERRSIAERLLLRDSALEVMRNGPLTGVGAGNGVLAQVSLTGRHWPAEPAHSVPLLAAAEIGAVGGAAWLAVVLALTGSLVRRRAGLDPIAWGFGAAALGLCIISLFDHYLWTLAPMRTLLFLWIGLWAASDRPVPALDPAPSEPDHRF
ncbi:MAG: O-antigen ligase family protein [Chloroflexi bacterium]|nr:O-antigen ligase family protein [Chloroflexota bacterium]